MRLHYPALALLAATGSASAQPPAPEGQIYAAHGTEPFWGLTFEDGKMIYSTPDDEERIEVSRPAPDDIARRPCLPDTADDGRDQPRGPLQRRYERL